MLTRLGVLGWPVAHSRSPAMQQAALDAAGLDGWTYQLLPVPPEHVHEAIRALPEAGLRGANVTIPHKRAALAAADTASAEARQIGAANTLVIGDAGAIHAENTDAPGFLDALPLDPDGTTALVLGAGGSARAVVHALRAAGARVVVWNRTADRARDLDAELVADAVPADLLVNCTSIGLDGDDADLKGFPLTADALGDYACVADLVYRTGGTALIREATTRGCEVVDGLEILVGQGARSFELWTGTSPDLGLMRAQARSDDHRRHV